MASKMMSRAVFTLLAVFCYSNTVTIANAQILFVTCTDNNSPFNLHIDFEGKTVTRYDGGMVTHSGPMPAHITEQVIEFQEASSPSHQNNFIISYVLDRDFGQLTTSTKLGSQKISCILRGKSHPPTTGGLEPTFSSPFGDHPRERILHK